MYMLAADNLSNVDAVDAQPSALGGPVLYRLMCDCGRLQIESECVSIVTGMILASVIVEPTASGAHTSLYLLHC